MSIKPDAGHNTKNVVCLPETFKEWNLVSVLLGFCFLALYLEFQDSNTSDALCSFYLHAHMHECACVLMHLCT